MLHFTFQLENTHKQITSLDIFSALFSPHKTKTEHSFLISFSVYPKVWNIFSVADDVYRQYLQMEKGMFFFSYAMKLVNIVIILFSSHFS